jgi:hypothetical protein
MSARPTLDSGASVTEAVLRAWVDGLQPLLEQLAAPSDAVPTKEKVLLLNSLINRLQAARNLLLAEATVKQALEGGNAHAKALARAKRPATRQKA